MKTFLLILIFAALSGCNRSGFSPDFRSPVFYIYATDGAANIYGFSVNLSTGLVSPNPGNPYRNPDGQITTGMTVDSTRNMVFTRDSGGSINIFSANPATGDLTYTGTRVLAPTSTNIYAIPQFNILYECCTGTNLYGYSYNSGALTILPGFPYTTFPNNSTSVTTDPLNKFLFIAGTGTVNSAVLSSSGIPALNSNPGGGCSGASADTGLSLDQTANYLFVANANMATFCNYSINPTSGTLTYLSSFSPASGGCDSIAVDGVNHFLVSIDLTNGFLSSYKFVNNGASFSALSSIAISLSSQGPIVDPTGHYAYLVGSPGLVYVYSINQTSGVFSLIQTQQTSGGALTSPFLIKLLK